MTAPATESAEAATAAPPSRSGRARRFVFIALGVTVYIVAVSLIGWRKVGGALAGADLPLIALAAALTLAGALIRMWKWRRALGARQQAIGLYFISRSGGIWSPGRVGEFLPLLWRRHRKSRVAAWILFDRVLEVLVTIVFGLIGLALIRFVPWPAYAALAAISTAGAIAGVYVLTRADWLSRLAARFAEGSRLKSALIAMADTSGEFRAFLASSTGFAALTGLAKGLDLVAVAVIFRALQYPVSVALVAASKCALAIVSYLPITPITTGIPHTVQGWIMYDSAAVQPETVAASIAIEAGIMIVVFALLALAAARAIRDATL